MSTGMEIAFFGSSLVSAFWNGAATYYRGVIRNLHERGHRITFYEPDAFERQAHRDIPDPPWARVVVYPALGTAGVDHALQEARRADLIIKASGIGVFDEYLEAAVPALRRPENLVVYWDVDAPATLDRVQADGNDPFRRVIPRYDLIFTYGGGEPVIRAYEELGARRCVPVYNALDPDTHFRAEPDARFDSELAFLGNRLPDRESRVEEFFFRAAAARPDQAFLLGGSGWESRDLPANVRHVGHVYAHEHNAFNSTPKAVLNINRESMARYGFSPHTPALGICQWFHFEDHRLDRAVQWLRELGVRHFRTGLSWADSLRPDAERWFDRQMRALDEFEVTLTFCFTPESHGLRPHHTSPPARIEDYAEFCARMVRRYA
jgi:spore maturation protein CgeB